MKGLLKITLLLSVFTLMSCATIISGSKQNVEITSEPTAAKVFINNIEIGQTPVQQSLARNQEYKLVLQLDGYQPYETKIVKKFNAWYIGNIVFGGIVGIVVDPITGAINKLEPEKIDGELKEGTEYLVEDQKLIINITMASGSNSPQVGQLIKSE